ncbi:MAG: His-Xaa-Ser system radical SAM maturase HxsB [Elusimicrobia bacterium]|nr:His-Xaa-Ser system radical SAM maturase HxsB [Elusimicrobiota bacterium]
MPVKTKRTKNKAKARRAYGVIPDSRWRRFPGKYLLVNDFGNFKYLKPLEFDKWLKSKLPEKSKIFESLAEKGFIRTRMNFDNLSARWRSANSYLFGGAGLHILVMTLRCNHTCVYCQSSAVDSSKKNTDMSFKTAKASVDFAFKSPNPSITIEFQGGEPLLNWDVLKKTVIYARSVEKKLKKGLILALVSNFSLMTEEKARFLMEHEVSICTSLDGPKSIHDKNRMFRKASSYDVTIKWLKYFNARHDRQNENYRIFKPSALLTVSKNSLASGEKIVDEYVKQGLEDIFIRPLAPIGYAKKYWDIIGYSADDFISFYRKALNHIVRLNAKKVIREKTAMMILDKVLNAHDPGYLDMRCPCGASIGQLAYNHNGDLYTCDEGRMIGWSGDEIFKTGNVFKDTYLSVMGSPVTKSCVLSSNLEQQPLCFRCAYKPFCGVCPVYNYETQQNLWGNMPSNERCKLFMGIFDAIFELLAKPKEAAILRKWVQKTVES